MKIKRTYFIQNRFTEELLIYYEFMEDLLNITISEVLNLKRKLFY